MISFPCMLSYLCIFLPFHEKVSIISKYFKIRVKNNDLKINNLNNPSLLEILDVFRVKIMREIIL